MNISAIVAVSQNGVIGNKGKLPWHLPTDLKRFRELTANKTVIMGRKTYESIGKPLPQRFNIVVSRRPDLLPLDGSIARARSVEDAIQLAKEAGDDVFIIGGAEIFREALPYCDTIEMTLVRAHVDGDTFFWPGPVWEIVAAKEHFSHEDDYPITFLTLKKSEWYDFLR